MRPHMQRNAVFAAFCENVESFEKLFKSDRNTRGYDGPSRRIPTFVRQYLHHQLERVYEFSMWNESGWSG